MAFVLKENSGSLFKNNQKSKETDPDYTGSFNVEGIEYWVSGWVNQSKDGKKYLRLLFKSKQNGAAKYGEGRIEVEEGFDDKTDDLEF